MHAFSKRPSRVVRVRRKKFSNFCRTLLTVNISEMAQVLTRQNLRSTRFLRNEMFSCTQSGPEDPTDEDWMHTLNESIVIENGIKLGITDAERVFQVIEPFAERLFHTTFYHRESINGDYKLYFEVLIRTLIVRVVVDVGVFYYRSDRNPFVPERAVTRINLNLVEYLNQPFIIGVRTKLLRLPPTQNQDNVESSSSNPLGKTFKSDQCVICLEEKPKVLFCNCGHICICKKCATHRYSNCPVCKKENTILRIIE